MNYTNSLRVAAGSLACFSVIVVGGLLATAEAGGGADGDYYDVTTVFVAEENYGGGGHDMEFYGSSGDKVGWAVGTTSCNRGNIVAPWYGGTDNTPVIAQNCYRYSDGRFEQIGLSWLKHSFCAISEPGCDTWEGDGCQSTGCDTLGVGCADTYWADLNADGDAPRSEINAYTGIYTYPFILSPSGPNAIRGKMQLSPQDIDPADNPGARYFVEGQYVVPNEHQFGVHMNNASYKEVGFNSISSSSGVGTTQHMIPGVYAWKVCDPEVTINDIYTVEEDGGSALGHVAYRASDNGDGTWHYEYVVHNQNSHRSFRSFSVPVPACVSISGVEFVDLDYHSGEVVDGTDWAYSRDGDMVTWSTESHDVSPNGNAIRWASMYTFRFDASTSPVGDSDGFAAYFRSGIGDGVGLELDRPGDCLGNDCPGDLNDDGIVSVEDILVVLDAFNQNDSGDTDGDGVTDVVDLLTVIGEYGSSC